jgi:hypothetical protein
MRRSGAAAADVSTADGATAAPQALPLHFKLFLPSIR